MKMGRAPCCAKVGLNRGPWTLEEDTLLAKYIETHGEGCWRDVPKLAGLLRCGKSCRLRWVNYLRPSVKRGNISEDEEVLIIKLHSLLGNRWSLIAGRISGRTDNEIKNYWNTHLSKKLRKMGIDPKTHKSFYVPHTEQSFAGQPKDEDRISTDQSKLSLKSSLHECIGKGVAPVGINVSLNSNFNPSESHDAMDRQHPRVSSLNNLQSVSVANIPSTSESFTSNWPASPSSTICPDISRSSDRELSSSALLHSTNINRFMISSESAPIPQQHMVNIISCHDIEGGFSQPNHLTSNERQLCRGVDRLSASLGSLQQADADFGFLEEEGVRDFSWKINEIYEAAAGYLIKQADLWHEFGHLISSSTDIDDGLTPRTSSPYSIDSSFLSLPNKYDEELLQELETSRRINMILLQDDWQYDETHESLCFFSSSEYAVDNPVYMSSKLLH